MICFWGFGDKTAGGMQSIILMLAKQANLHNEKLKIYSFEESYLYRMIVANKIDVVFFDIVKDSERIKKSFKKDDVLIITGINQFPKELLKYNPKILFWMVYLFTFREKNSFLKIHFKNFTAKVVKYLVKNKSFLTVDGNCFTELGISPDIKKILPIPFSFNDQSATLKNINHKKIALTYIGRAVNWKIIPIKKIIKDLEEINRNFVLYIITDEIHNFSDSMGVVTSKNYTVSFIDHLTQENLRNFLINNSDIHFGMGTSAIEGASLGIPTVTIDTSFHEFPENYKYRWIFENKYFSTGDFIKKKQHFHGKTLSTIMNELINEKNKHNQIGKKCCDYVKKNHEIEKIYQQLKMHATNSSARFNKMYSAYLINSPFYRFFLLSYIEKFIRLLKLKK